MLYWFINFSSLIRRVIQKMQKKQQKNKIKILHGSSEIQPPIIFSSNLSRKFMLYSSLIILLTLVLKIHCTETLDKKNSYLKIHIMKIQWIGRDVDYFLMSGKGFWFVNSEKGFCKFWKSLTWDRGGGGGGAFFRKNTLMSCMNNP